ncbi:multiheme c-type cytochrome [Pontiellaceae bacterium B12227]|nr:multiheme c-type cytochrome [Pontiellaceae bacterium B12227]
MKYINRPNQLIRSPFLFSMIVLCRSSMADGEPLASYQMDDFAGSANCALCHSSLTDEGGNDVSIDAHWRSTMMANSAKDPLWQAKVSSEVQRNPALKTVIEKKCATCHTPIARTQAIAHNEPVGLFDDGFLNNTNTYHVSAMDGISCTLCHQITPDGLGTNVSFSGGYVIDTNTVSPNRLIHGPFPNPFENQMRNNVGFTPVHGEQTLSSALCGTCHNLYTPYVDAAGVVQGEFPEQMVYGEWEHSGYNGGTENKSCQDCHMPVADGGVVLANRGVGLSQPARSPFGQHHFVGANVFMLDILSSNLVDLAVSASSAQLADTRQRTTDQLQLQAAELEVTALRVGTGTIEVGLHVKNLAGHKLPSGFPSRRSWLHVTIADHAGAVFFESGKPLPDGRIEGNDADIDITSCEPHYRVITQTNQVQIYESVMEDTDSNITYTLLRGAAYRKDNRLLPNGFDPVSAHPDIAVVGEASSDSDFIGGGDLITYKVNTESHLGPYDVSVELLYQPASWAFVQDLAADSSDEIGRFTGYYSGADHTPAMLVTNSATIDPSKVHLLSLPQKQTNPGMQLLVEGPTGGVVSVNWSSNLQHWTQLTTIEQTNSAVSVYDAGSSNMPTRFYRLGQP